MAPINETGNYLASPSDVAAGIQDELRYHWQYGSGGSPPPPRHSFDHTLPIPDFGSLALTEDDDSVRSNPSGLYLDLEHLSSERLAYYQYDTSIPLPRSPTSSNDLSPSLTSSENSSTLDFGLLHPLGELHLGVGMPNHGQLSGRGRARSLSRSGRQAQRSRSASFTGYNSEGNFPSGHSLRGSRAESVISDASSVDPQLLSCPLSSAQSSSSTLYSSQNGSSSSFVSSEPGSDTWHAQVATEKTKMASQRRRKRNPRFFCDVPGCHGSFTSKHNLDSKGWGFVCIMRTNCAQLVDHSNSHRGVRNFECSICQQKFTTRAVLNRHVKKLHSSKS